MIKHAFGIGFCLPKKTIRSFAAGSSLLLSTLALFGQTTSSPSTSVPPSSEQGETVVLSPFVVDASKDTGYQAQNTLSGTRLNTSVGDLGTTMTILTPDAWKDLGVFSTNDLILFTPGGEKNDTQQFEGNGGNLFWGDQTRFRGIQVENIVRNYFRTEIPSDTYNADRFEFTRGPNAILFGVAGDASGLVNRMTQDANLSKRSYQYSLQLDNFGSVRNSLNGNEVLQKDKLAVRVALLDYDQERWLRPVDFQDQRREYVAVQYKPFKNLTLKANWEHFDSLRAATAGNIPFDSVTPWIAAGKPGRASVPGAAPVNPAGIVNFAANAPRLMAVYDGSSSGPVFQDWNNRAIGANLTVLGTTNVTLPVGYVDTRFDPSGEMNIQDLSGHVVNFFADYAVNKDLNIQLAVNDETSYYDFFSDGGGRLNVDASTTLSDGSANPNFGRFYVIHTPSFRLKQQRYRRDDRVTASYHFDFAKHTDKLSWLGVHDFAAMYERDTSEHYWDVLTLRNTTPLAGSSVLLGDNANLVRFVNYVDINTDTVYGMHNALDLQAEANKLPGVHAAWLPSGGPTAFKTMLASQLYVLQSRFWGNRIVTTLGWRKDAIDKYALDTTKLTPLYPTGPGAAFSNYARSYPMSHDLATSALAPENKSIGAVFHVLRNKGIVDDVALTYNTSTSFTVTDFTLYVDRHSTPPQSGRTKDFGVRTELLNHKLGLVATVFEASVQNINDVRVDTAGISSAISDLSQMIGKTEFVNVPQSRDIEDKISKGWELQMTASLTPGWRVMGSVSYYKTTNSNVADFTGQFIDQYKSQWLANPSAIVPNRTDTAQTVVDNMIFAYQTIKASEGTRALNERRYKYVGITNYTFSSGPLKGFSLGGNVVWQSTPATGYAVKPVVNASTGATTFVPDASHPFFGSTLMNLGASAGYNRKIWNDKVNWSVQFNVRNLLKVDPFVTRTGATATAPTTAVARLYSRGEPTTYMLTNTFQF